MTTITADPRFGGPIVELDVRDDLRQRREPFAKIMAAVDALGAGEVLHLRTTFEPFPLLRVLAKRGFAHHVQEHAPDDWSVWLHQLRDARVEGDPTAVVTPRPGAAPAGREIVLDVRGLEPPEPMVRTLDALETLPAGGVLVQLNDRIPQFLLPILDERGFRHDVDASAADHVVVRIRRRSVP
jgi:uncharacterized protein (DUF2249 family)